MGSSAILKGQTTSNEICTHTPSTNILGTLPTSAFSQGEEENDYVIRVYIHVIRRTDGTGGRTLAEVNQLIANLNSGFGAFGDIDADGITESIRFRFEEVSYIDCDRYHLTGGNLGDLVSVNDHTNGIDIYFPPSHTKPTGIALGNPSTALLIGGNTQVGRYYANSPAVDIGLSNIIVHEMGHALGLYHVYQSYCNVQLNISCHETTQNGKDCGDFVPDTPPIWNRNGLVNDANCSVSTQTDLSCNKPGFPNPSPIDDSDLINYMQITHPSCMSEFTQGQVNRMFKCLKTSKILRPCLTNEAASNNYTVVPSATFSNLTGNILPIGQTTWQAPLNVNGTVTVPLGAELVIRNTTIRFANQSKIIVQKGGILRVDNARLTVDKCTNAFSKWKGIIVYGFDGKIKLPIGSDEIPIGGNPLQNFISSQFGYVEVINDSKIEYAEIAIAAIGNSAIVPSTQAGTTFFPVNPVKLGSGILFISESIFRNNDEAIQMKNLSGESAQNNTITNNEFTITGLASSPTRHISLIRAGIVMIQGNRFSYSSVHIPINGIIISSTSVIIGGIGGTESNTFSNLKTAIDVYSTNSIHLTEIINNRFYQNKTGIVLNSIPNATIQANTVLIPLSGGEGVISYDATSFDISFNHFRRFNANLSSFSSVGLLIVNSKNNDPLLMPTSLTLDNTFCGNFTAATQFERNNTGVQLQCNHYDGATHDWYLANTSTIDELAPQGDCTSPVAAAKNPFGNTWHDVGGGNNTSKHIANFSDRKLVLYPDNTSIPTQFEVGPLGQDGQQPNIEINNTDCEFASANCSDPLSCSNIIIHQAAENSGRGSIYAQLKEGNEAGVIDLLENEQAEWSDKWLVGIYANRRDSTRAAQTLAQIPKNTPENIAFHDMFEALINTDGNFSVEQEQMIRNYALSTDFEIQTLAEMFLVQYFDESFERIPMPIVSSSSKKENISSEGFYFSLFPNPANHEINIHLSHSIDTSISHTVKIIDPSGKVLIQTTVDESIAIDTEKLAVGIYFVVVHNPQTFSSHTEKLIILK